MRFVGRELVVYEFPRFVALCLRRRYWRGGGRQCDQGRWTVRSTPQVITDRFGRCVQIVARHKQPNGHAGFLSKEQMCQILVRTLLKECGFGKVKSGGKQMRQYRVRRGLGKVVGLLSKHAILVEFPRFQLGSSSFIGDGVGKVIAGRICR